MSNRNLMILAITAVVMVLLAMVTTKMARQSRTTVEGSTALIQGLDPDKVMKIVITSQTDGTLSLERRGSGFVVADKHGYPAKTAEINELITTCLDIQTSGAYTESAQNHEALGVSDEEAEKSVRFYGSDDKMITGILLGKQRDQDQGKYVRLAGQDAVYITYQIGWVSTRAKDYMETDLGSYPKAEVESVTVKAPDSQYTLVKDEQGRVVPQSEYPEGLEPKQYEIDAVFQALDRVSFEDVYKAGIRDDLVFDHTYICTMDTSARYTIELAVAGDETFIRCSAEFLDQTPITKDRGVESEEQLKEKEAKLLAMDAVEEFNARHQGWVYKIVNWQKENFTKDFDALFEVREEPDQEAQASDQPAEPAAAE